MNIYTFCSQENIRKILSGTILLICLIGLKASPAPAQEDNEIKALQESIESLNQRIDSLGIKSSDQLFENYRLNITFTLSLFGALATYSVAKALVIDEREKQKIREELQKVIETLTQKAIDEEVTNLYKNLNIELKKLSSKIKGNIDFIDKKIDFLELELIDLSVRFKPENPIDAEISKDRDAVENKYRYPGLLQSQFRAVKVLSGLRDSRLGIEGQSKSLLLNDEKATVDNLINRKLISIKEILEELHKFRQELESTTNEIGADNIFPELNRTKKQEFKQTLEQVTNQQKNDDQQKILALIEKI